MIYFFYRSGNTWSQQDATTAFDRDVNNHFGYSVSLSGDYAIVGASNVGNVPLTNNGAAYIYVRTGTTWTLKAKLNAPDATTAANVGNSVSINGDNVFVGSWYANTAQGSSYIYKRTNTPWTLVRKVEDGSGQSNGLFGTAVGVSGYKYIIGAAGENSSKGEVSFLNIQ